MLEAIAEEEGVPQIFCQKNSNYAEMGANTCLAINGEITQSCQATPILQPPQQPLYGRDSSRPPPLYYNLHGQPLGTQKPTAPGVYIEKHGKHTPLLNFLSYMPCCKAGL
ncbi:MAG: hypothetical protein LBC85_05080 [Fibromonadaceae bacterium]|nr:hypothetical protein [Fibromonadaceae bacterium]